MADKPAKWSRRDLLRKGAATVTAVFLGRFVASSPAAEQDMQRLSEDDPQAKALKYTHDASTVKSQKRQEGAICANCTHWQADADTTWGPCAIFPGKKVNKDGWCTAWAAQQGS